MLVQVERERDIVLSCKQLLLETVEKFHESRVLSLFLSHPIQPQLSSAMFYWRLAHGILTQDFGQTSKSYSSNSCMLRLQFFVGLHAGSISNLYDTLKADSPIRVIL